MMFYTALLHTRVECSTTNGTTTILTGGMLVQLGEVSSTHGVGVGCPVGSGWVHYGTQVVVVGGATAAVEAGAEAALAPNKDSRGGGKAHECVSEAAQS